MTHTIRTVFVTLVLSACLAPGSLVHAQDPVEPTKHTVAFGETLQTLSQLTGVSIAELAQLNGLSRVDHLMVGQVILMSTALATDVRLHRVEAKETLSSIAMAYGISPYASRRANDLPCSACMTPGTILRIPMPTDPVASTAPVGVEAPSAQAIPFPFVDIELSSAQPKQGDVLIIQVNAPQAEHVAGRTGSRDVTLRTL